MLRPFIHTLMTGSQQGPQPEVWTNILSPENWDPGPSTWIGNEIQSFNTQYGQFVQLNYIGSINLEFSKYRITFSNGYSIDNYGGMYDRSENTISAFYEVDDTGVQEILAYKGLAPLDSFYMSVSGEMPFVISKIEVSSLLSPRSFEGWVSMFDPEIWEPYIGTWDNSKVVSGEGENFDLYTEGYFNNLLPTKVKVYYNSTLGSPTYNLILTDYWDEREVTNKSNYVSGTEEDILLDNSSLYDLILQTPDTYESSGHTEITDVQFYFPSGSWTNFLDLSHFEVYYGTWDSPGVLHSAYNEGEHAIAIEPIGSWFEGYSAKKVRAILNGLEVNGANEGPMFLIGGATGFISKASVPYFSKQEMSWNPYVGDLSFVGIAADSEFTISGLEFFV